MLLARRSTADGRMNFDFIAPKLALLRHLKTTGALLRGLQFVAKARQPRLMATSKPGTGSATSALSVEHFTTDLCLTCKALPATRPTWIRLRFSQRSAPKCYRVAVLLRAQD